MEESYIVFADGSSHLVHWCGVNPADRSLDLLFLGTTEDAVRELLSDSAKLTSLTFYDGARQTTYFGYTVLDTVSTDPSGQVFAALVNPGNVDHTEVLG